jgi:hypothetical protein
MIDVKQAVRTAFFQALDGNLQYQSVAVPIADGLKPPTEATLYVILGSQSGVPKNTFNGWASEESIDLDIISKTDSRGAKEPLDQVAGQILAIICPAVDRSGIVPQAHVQIINVRLDRDQELALSLNSSNTVTRRLLTFKMYVAQL